MLNLFYYRETSAKASLFFRLLNNQIIFRGHAYETGLFYFGQKSHGTTNY